MGGTSGPLIGRPTRRDEDPCDRAPLTSRTLSAGYNAGLKRWGPEDKDVLEFAGWIAELYDAWGQPQLAAAYRAVSQGDAVAEVATPLAVATGQN